MGLDMYLSVRKYISRFDYSEDYNDRSENQTFSNLVTVLNADNIVDKEDSTGMTVEVPVAYWRKANQIHSWIVDNLADGVDECQSIYVSEKAAEELLGVCKEVLADYSKAPELLPPSSGFFFGSLEYDEWYFNQIKYTIKVLTKLLDEAKLGNIESVVYQASW